MLLLAEDEIPLLDRLAEPLHIPGFVLGAFLAVVLVSFVCGMVGTLVVGNRMSFFSDAMSHCAFAGVALGILITFLIGDPSETDDLYWLIPLIMVSFGACVGIGIELVREKTGLSSDTVIGVFFAGAIGFASMLLTALGKRSNFNPELFMFGSPLFVKVTDLVYLTCLIGLTGLFLMTRYNSFVLGSFNTSLARSRNVALRLNNYAFIVLLALIVNFSIVAVGVLLINALLVVPAAAASNLARNLRQLFWMTIVLSVGCGVIGLQLSRTLIVEIRGQSVQFGPSGMIIVLTVICFFASIFIAAFRTRFERLGTPRRQFARN